VSMCVYKHDFFIKIGVKTKSPPPSLPRQGGGID
jgi:hypothetical protein